MKRARKCERCNRRVAIIVTRNKDRHCYCARHGREALEEAQKPKQTP